jgi:hypothetical protein
VLKEHIMGRTSFSLLAILVVAAGSVVVQQTSAQEGTLTPGQPTQARVWIENRGPGEAIPVTVQAIAGETLPVQVEIVGMPTVEFGPKTAVEARTSRQQWEYQNVRLPPNGDPTAVLNAAGMEGWETTGLLFPASQGSIIVMKRPR